MMRPRTASEREMHGETPQVGTISFGAGPSLAGQLALDMSKLNAQIFRSEERKQLEMRIIERMAPKLIGYMRDDWPKLALDFSTSRRVNLDTITRSEVLTWKSGDRLLLSGKLLTGRDAAHKRLVDMIDRGEPLPVAPSEMDHAIV